MANISEVTSNNNIKISVTKLNEPNIFMIDHPKTVSQEFLEYLYKQNKLIEKLKEEIKKIEKLIEPREEMIINIIENKGSIEKGLFIPKVEITERRTPSWKSEFIAITSKEKAEEIIKNTEPKESKSLSIEVNI